MKILIVEDETKIADFVQAGLIEEGFGVVVAPTGEKALRAHQSETFTAFIIDVMLPDADGIELCKQLREDGVTAPIMILSAMGSVADKVRGLAAGADDYMSKPFEYEELVARLKALIRKTQGYPRSAIQIADLIVEPISKTVQRGSETIELSKKEYQLLEYLARNHDRLVTREMISKSVWDCDTNTYTNIIDVFINYLRKKIDTRSETKLIHTIRGKGFILSETVPVAKA